MSIIRIKNVVANTRKYIVYFRKIATEWDYTRNLSFNVTFSSHYRRQIVGRTSYIKQVNVSNGDSSILNA